MRHILAIVAITLALSAVWPLGVAGLALIADVPSTIRGFAFGCFLGALLVFTTGYNLGWLARARQSYREKLDKARQDFERDKQRA